MYAILRILIHGTVPIRQPIPSGLGLGKIRGGVPISVLAVWCIRPLYTRAWPLLESVRRPLISRAPAAVDDFLCRQRERRRGRLSHAASTAVPTTQTQARQGGRAGNPVLPVSVGHTARHPVLSPR